MGEVREKLVKINHTTFLFSEEMWDISRDAWVHTDEPEKRG